MVRNGSGIKRFISGLYLIVEKILLEIALLYIPLLFYSDHIITSIFLCDILLVSYHWQVIFYEQDWNPQVDKQALQRAHRIGQSNSVLSINLVTGRTVEEVRSYTSSFSGQGDLLHQPLLLKTVLYTYIFCFNCVHIGYHAESGEEVAA